MEETAERLGKEIAEEIAEETAGEITEKIAKEAAEELKEEIAEQLTETVSETIAEGAGNLPQIANKGNSVGRVAANNLNEQLAMKQVMSNPLSGATKLPVNMTDSRWLASDGWVKMQNIVNLSDGTKINIHFVYNKALNLVDDFKFK